MIRVSRTSVCRLALLIGCLLLMAHSAGAQGRRPRNAKKPPSAGSAGRTQIPVATGTALPAWLDDAETLDAKSARADLSVGRWSTVDGGETYGPVLDVDVGATSWLQLSATLPYYRASYNDGYTAHGLGDSYFLAKVQLRDPSEYAVGLSVQPLVEVLSDASVSDTTLGLKRVNWGLPVSVELGSEDTRTRAYATAGYFSRHTVFAGGAVEKDLFAALTVGASVNYSYATQSPAASDLAGLSRSRTDAGVFVYVSVTPKVTLFGDIGRTVSKLDQNGARLIASVGIRIETSPPTTHR
jgi:hypothetical protein